jgi:type I restriction enzyme M protein
MNASSLIQKVWSFCNTLRDDGVGYGDYLEQLAFLIFLKMADENGRALPKDSIIIPEGYDWQSLLSKNDEFLEAHYYSVLLKLGSSTGVLGAIFFKAQNKIQDPAKLARLIQMINEVNWKRLDSDVKGDLYEGLLQKNAEDTKSGAGQYFTPRALIQAIVECVQPKPLKTIADPACGTGGFFLGVNEWFNRPGNDLSAKEKKFLQTRTFFGNEIVASTRRMCLMNLFLHNLGELSGEPTIERDDALATDTGKRYDYVLANPPFGKKSAVAITNGEGNEEKEKSTYERKDFTETTSNKQLNFLQHIMTILKSGGEAAVVLPDNVLFEGGAGEKIRRRLLDQFYVHTILRLPTGIFYAQGVKANVVFFDAKPKARKDHSDGIWYYDLRTSKHFTLKTRPLMRDDLKDFIDGYCSGSHINRKETDRFKFYSYSDLMARDKVSLDIFWLKDDSLDELENLPSPDVLMLEIIDHLEGAILAFRDVSAALPPSPRKS